MDWFILVFGVACFIGGCWCYAHKSSYEAAAAKAVLAATTTHTGTSVDSALKTVGAEVNKLITPATPAAAIDPATAAALATLK